MDGMRVGRSLRAIRHHLEWRQRDVGAEAGVSQDEVSLAERGFIGRMPLDTLEAIANAEGAELVVLVRWRGAELDRLLDEGHATLVGAAMRLLKGLGWTVEPEVSFSIYGERGSLDLLAWHSTSGTLIVVEVKTELVSVEELLRTLDRKVRLAPTIAAERFGWRAASAARLLVLPAASTPRRQVARHDVVLGQVFPMRGAAAKGWLRAPTGARGLLLFLPMSSTIPGRVGRRRVSGRRARKQGDA